MRYTSRHGMHQSSGCIKPGARTREKRQHSRNTNAAGRYRSCDSPAQYTMGMLSNHLAISSLPPASASSHGVRPTLKQPQTPRVI